MLTKGYSEAEADEMVANTIAQKERAVAEAEQAVAEAQAELDAVGAERPTVALSEDSEDEYLAQKAEIDRRRGVAQQKVASAQSALDTARHELTHWQAIRDAAQRRKAQSAEVQSTESTGVQSTEGQGAEVRSKVEEEQPNKSKYELSNEVDENGRQFVLTSEGNLEFGEISADTGLPAAPILLSEGMITNPETNDGYGLVHIEARHGDQIRKAGYDSVVDFVEEVAKNYEVIREGNLRDGIKTYMLQLTDKHNNTLMVELSGDGTYWNINTAGIFKTSYGAKRNVVYNRHTTAKQSAETAEASLSGEQGGTTPSTSMNTPTQTSNDVSVGKGSENSATGKGESEKSGEGGDVISGKPIQGLDGRSEEEVLAIVRDHIEEVLSDEGVDGVTLKGMALHGSRLRGDAKEGSDLDVVVEFDGDMREDDMFNMLNAESNRLSIDGISVDINPIREDKSGTLERYMERSRKYDESKGGRERTEEESRGKKADGVATRREVELRDALVEVMRQAGLAVVVDDAEGQRVLDAAKRAADVLDEMKRKSAQETALPEGETSFKGTVISSADGAKVLQNLETLIKNAEKLDAAGQRNFLGEVAKALGARRYGSGSQYATFETVNGEVVTIRLADHNAHVSGFDNAGRDNGISIVISRKPNNGVLDDGDAHVVEFFYKDKDLRKAEGSPYAAIARSIGQALYSGEYRDTTGLAQREEVNAENVIREMRVWHGTAADFEAFDHSHMGEGEGAQAYGWGTYVTMVDGIARSYAMQDARKRPSYYWKGQKIDTESVNPLRMAYDVVEREGSIKKALALVERFLENPDAHEGWAAVRDILKQSRKSDFTSKQTRYLYEVEIPDSRADFEEDNARYNEELDAFGRGELKGVAIHFGQAGGILRALGFGSGRGMMMSVRKFKEHLDKHGLTLDDVRDLPKALNKPLMVYEWGTQHKSTIVVTELTTADGRKITAAVKLHKDFTGDGSTIVVDEIASVHGKDAERMLSELLDEQERKVHGGVENILKYVKDKEKVLDWLGMYPPKGSISLSDQELSLAKIIKDFENPSDAVENYGDYIPYDEPLSGEHIIDKHVGEGKDFADEQEMMHAIDNVIKNGTVIKEKWDKVIFEKDGKRVVVSKNVRDRQGNIVENKNWVVTSYDSNIPKSEKGSASTRVTPESNKGGRAVTPEAFSDNKGSEKAATAQEKTEESGEGGDVISGKPIQGLEGRSEEEVQAHRAAAIKVERERVAAEQAEQRPVINDGRGGDGSLAGRKPGDLAQTEALNNQLLDEVDENGIPFVKSEDGSTVFGEIREDSGLSPAPIKLSQGYQDENGKGYGLAHIEANHGEQIRNAGFASVEDFVRYVAQNYDEDNIRVGKRRENGKTTYLIQVTDEHDNTLFIEMSRDGSYWNVNSAGVFRKGYSNKKETVAKTEPQQPTNAVSTGSSLSASEVSGITPAEPNGKPTVSNDKGSENSATGKEKTEKVAESKASTVIAEAEQDVNTEPTDAQKEAGNYKKGHIKLDGFDISIEQPKGSTRSGRDASGKEWSVTMQNTYGYIRGTEGVDGDHIDVFLSDNMDEWNGTVYVIDQVKADGSFDEHKVMYGFNSADEAAAAYNSNYSEGWQGLGTITGVSKEEFKKWIGSSHRKTKPFADYKKVKTDEGQSKPVVDDMVENPDNLEALRAKHPNALFLVRGQKLYKAYGEDAKKLGEILGVEVKSDKKYGFVASFDHNDLDTNLPKLVRAGLRVAITDTSVLKGDKPASGKKKTTKAADIAAEQNENNAPVRPVDGDIARFHKETDSSGRTAIDEANYNADDLVAPLLVDGKKSHIGIIHIVPDDINAPTYTRAYYNYAHLIDPETNKGWQAVGDKIDEWNGSHKNDEQGFEDGDAPMVRFASVDAALKFAEWFEGENIRYDQQGKPIQGLEGRSEEEVLAIVRGHIEEVLSDEGVDGVTLKGMALHGSRLRGDAKEGSDLDVVVEFDGDMREDDMFNMLNAESNRLSIDGISVDINPIREDKSGTLERYMERSRQYDESKGGRERKQEDERGQGALDVQRTEVQKDGSAEEEAIERKAKADGSWMTAPNGERSRLAPRQWLQTRTKAFKKWFGDSKIVDENGEPLVVDGCFVSTAIDFVGKYNELIRRANDVVARIRDIERASGTHFPNMEFMYADGADDVMGVLTNDNDVNALVESILNGEEPVVRLAFRYGDVPEGGRSLNYRDNEREKGVSVVGRVADMNTRRSSYYETWFGDEPYNIVVGLDLGNRGADGEMLLTAPVVLCKAQDAGDVVKSATDNNGDFSRSNPDIRYAVSEDSRGRERTEEESRGKKADGVATRREVELRDALVEVMRQTGLAVVVDDAEGQRRLEAARRAMELLDEMKKRNQQKGTRLPEDESSFKGTAVSSADGAKILQNLDAAKEKYEKSLDNRPRSFLGDIADAIGATKFGSNSRYATFETMNGEVVTLRLADHNAHTSGFDNEGRDNGISIVISRRPNEGINNDGDAHVVEFFYSDKAIQKADGKPLVDIIKSIQQMLYSGEYNDTTGLAQREEVNASTLDEMRVWHGTDNSAESAALFDGAKKKFGVTRDIREAGYVLPDGTMLDFSGRHELLGADDSDIRGHRFTDHRAVDQIGWMYDENGDEVETGLATDMPDFIERGAIRIDCNAGTINLATAPTAAQRKVLRELIARNGGDVQVDFGNGWDSAHYAEYSEAKATRVLGDIERYFSEGVRPKGDIQFFRTEEGEVYGFVKDGVIYLDPKLADAETAIHEYGHLWGEALRAKNPAAWARLRGEMEADAELMAYVKSLYPELEGDALIDEVFQRYAGKRGAERLRAERDRMLGQADGILGKAGVVALFDKLRRLLERFWRMSRDLFAGVVDGLDRLSGADFADMMLADLLGGFNPNAAGARGEGLVAETGVADPFYSNAARAVENIKQNKAKAEQWKAMLTKAGGIKAGEDKWMGLSAWLDEHKGETLTKEQVLAFVRENGVKMEERKYIEAPYSFESLKREYDQWLHDEGFDYAQEQLLERFGDDADLAFDDLGGELVIANEEAAAALLGSEDIINSTRLDYTTEGLENKREIAFVVPGVEPYQEGDEVHFGPENEGRAVMWVRFGETTDEDGNRVLVIDEIQSNRHQDAREKGYEDPALTERLKQIQQEIDAATKEFGDFNDTLRQKYGVSTNYTKIEKTREEWGWNHRLVPDEDVLTKEEAQKWKEGDEKIKALRDVKDKLLVDRMGQEGVPAAPFEKNWHEVAMKRMLRLAAEEGFDKVAWTTGEQQAERYNLGRAFDSIERGDNPNMRDRKRFVLSGSNMETVEVNNEGMVVGSTLTSAIGKDLREVVGQSVAEKMMGLEDGDMLEGEDLRIGGEGMKGFYDQMLPRFMDKYGKKWGVKTGEVRLSTPGGEVMHSVDVTDAMRRSVLTEGQPLFQKAEDARGRQRTGEDARYREDDAQAFHDVIDEMFDNEDFDRKAHARERYDLGATPDWMRGIGITGENFSLSFKNIKTHIGKDADHDLTREEWHQLPDALKMPFAITRYNGAQDRFRLYVNILHNGKFVAVGVDVKRVNRGRGVPMLEVNSIKTVFAHQGEIGGSEELLTYDEKITPEQEALLRGLNFREYPTIQELSATKVENKSDIAKENVEDVASEGGADYREVSDEELIAWLEKQPKMRKIYRSMVLIDGKLYPPMSSRESDTGALRHPEELGRWTESQERPDLSFYDEKTGKWYFRLVKSNGKQLGKVLYNPYIHTSTTMLNDQFKEAQSRPDLVVVEMEIPVGELDGVYRAEHAADPTGRKPWNAGVIQKYLTGTRDVILSRWAKPVRIVPNDEVARHIYDMIKGRIEVMPTNVVTPQVRAEMEKLGVKFVETDNRGNLVGGEHAGESWTKGYGGKTTKQGRFGKAGKKSQGDSVRFSESEGENTKTQLRDEILATKNIEVKTPSDETAKQLLSDYKANAPGWRQRMLDWITKIVPQRLRTVVEMVSFSKGSARDAMAHGKGDLKMLIVPHIEKMLGAGVVFGINNDGKFTYYNIAHRMRYNGEDYVARFVIREDRNGKRYYDHEFTEIKKVGELPTAQGRSEDRVEHLTHQPAAKLLQEILLSKESDEKSADGVREAAVGLGEKLGVKVRLVESRSELPSNWSDKQKRRRDPLLKNQPFSKKISKTADFYCMGVKS